MAPRRPGPVIVARRDGGTEPVDLRYDGAHAGVDVWAAHDLELGDDLLIGELPANTEVAAHYCGGSHVSVGIDAWDRVRMRAWLDPPPV